MNSITFPEQVRQDYRQFMQQQTARFPQDDCLKIDLHCHDHNSDQPDELWGKLLKLPETWLPTKQLVKRLLDARVDLITVTNHNNARSCWKLLEDGVDVLPGAEFTCHFPDEPLSVHVLTYGFTPEQEVRLNRLRKDIYKFAAYTCEQNLPTILAHPLFFYTHRQKPHVGLLEKLALIFERFEALNGQRGYWQNQLTQQWVASLTEEKLQQLSRKHGLDPKDFCRHPYRKAISGGSDDHNGIFAGECGTRLYLPNLQQRLLQEKPSVLALEALRNGQMAPYGEPGEEERLTTTFLDYFAQVALNMKDPGLLRLMLHQGELKDKMMCLGISNIMQELQRHNYTLMFLKTFHQALAGKKPAMWTQLGVSKEFRPLLNTVKKIAKARRHQPEDFTTALRQQIPEFYTQITHIFFQRLQQETARLNRYSLRKLDSVALLDQFELPTSFRSLFRGEKPSGKPKKMTQLNLLSMMDQLSFPALAALVIGGASFTGSQILYSNRDFLNDLADDIDYPRPAPRTLWLTDSLADSNGVSSVLKTTLAYIQQHKLPIDLLTCHPDLPAAAHLKVVRPVSAFNLQPLGGQKLYMPDLLQIQQLFEQGGYDRIICSTELVMGPVALYLKKAFSVPAFFYMHTDWHEFFKRSVGLDQQQTDRLRRLLRLFYHRYDGLFVLNHEHYNWLASDAIGYPREQLHLTAHWVDQRYHQLAAPKTARLTRKLLYVGRLSREKGVLDLVEAFRMIRLKEPDAQLILAGDGPLKKKLQRRLPDAEFLGWVDAAQLPEIYQQADLLLLPSRFDTFGCVVLEAMSCGLPVVAYNTKGPKDIIHSAENGYLAEDAASMAEAVLDYWQQPAAARKSLRQAAQQRARSYQADGIMQQMQDVLKVVTLDISELAISQPATVAPDLGELNKAAV